MPDEVERTFKALKRDEDTGTQLELLKSLDPKLHRSSRIILNALSSILRRLPSLFTPAVLAGWIGFGIWAAATCDFKIRVPFWISIVALFWFFVTLLIREIRHNCTVIYFFAHDSSIPRDSFEEYLQSICRKANSGILCKILSSFGFLRPHERIFIRASNTFLRQRKATRKKIQRILHTATHLAHVEQTFRTEGESNKTTDKYLVTRFILNQKLFDLAVAVTSLWAMSWGFCQKYGIMVALLALLVTLGCFYWRFLRWIRTMRRWVKALPYIFLNPVFQEVEAIYPKAANHWNYEYGLEPIDLHDVIGSWVYHGIVGIYLLIYLQLAGLEPGGKLWQAFSHSIKILHQIIA